MRNSKASTIRGRTGVPRPGNVFLVDGGDDSSSFPFSGWTDLALVLADNSFVATILLDFLLELLLHFGFHLCFGSFRGFLHKLAVFTPLVNFHHHSTDTRQH
jgi:hypothetical protein